MKRFVFSYLVVATMFFSAASLSSCNDCLDPDCEECEICDKCEHEPCEPCEHEPCEQCETCGECEPCEHEPCDCEGESAIFTVTYMTDGNIVKEFLVAGGSTLSKPVLAPRAGYIFAGWYKDEEFENAWDFASDVVTADTALYARWTQGEKPCDCESCDCRPCRECDIEKLRAYSFTVYECSEMFLAFGEPYYPASGATVSVRDKSGNAVGQYTTDDDGKLIIILEDREYYYQVTKGNASNIFNGFLIAGIFQSEDEALSSPHQPSQINTPTGPVRAGGLKFADLNGDGIINSDDRPVGGYVALSSSQDVYIAAANFAPNYGPLVLDISMVIQPGYGEILVQGDEVVLGVYVSMFPWNTPNSGANISSSNSAVISISQETETETGWGWGDLEKWTIKAESVGTATITATSKDDSSKSASITFTVVAASSLK